MCTVICGDGIQIVPESCDDGTLNNEGCNPTCSGSLVGWTCSSGTPNSPSICNPICNDGIVIGNEICDDGLADNQGCDSSCSGIISGW